MGDAAKISLRIPSTSSQIAILSLQIIHTIPTSQIYVAMDNPSLFPSTSHLDSSSYFWNDVCAADNVLQTEILQTNWCQLLGVFP
jgi:hypothetical protein